MSETNHSDLSILEKWIFGIAMAFAGSGLLIFIIAIYLFQHNEPFNYGSSINSNKFGDLGSFISGAVGVIWSFVSVLLFYLALRLQRSDLKMQREELVLQREELALTREEMALTRQEIEGQKHQMEKQNETLTLQQFENTFFQLLNVHNSMSDMMYTMDKTQHAVSSFLRGFSSNLQNHKNLNKRQNIEYEEFELIYAKAIFSYRNVFIPYLTNLYHLIKFIDKSQIPNKKNYTNLVRAQLSPHELSLLYYNGITTSGIAKFKPLLEKYTLLKNMDKSIEHFVDFNHMYVQTAFNAED